MYHAGDRMLAPAVRPTTDSGLVADWWPLTALCAAPAVLAIWYGLRVFTDVPFIDDWLFVDRVFAYRQGELGLWSYLFTPHNGHPVVITRLLLIAIHDVAGLNLQLLRWMSLCLHLATTLVCVRLVLGPRQGSAFSTVWSSVLVAALGTTLAQWESYAVASDIGNAITAFCAVTAIYAFGQHLRTAHSRWLALSLAAAMAATVSMSQGFVVWMSLAIMAVFLRSHRGVVLTTVLVLFAAGGCGILWLSGRVVFLAGGLHAMHMLASVPLLVALPFVNPMDSPGYALAGIVTGVVLLVILAVLLAVLGRDWFRSPRLSLAESAPHLALIVLGLGTIVLIVSGRRAYPLTAIAASRYGAPLLPLAVGLIGLAAHSVQRTSSRARRAVCTALIVIAAAGWTVNNYHEAIVGPFRFAIMSSMRRSLVLGTLQSPRCTARALILDDFYSRILVPRTLHAMRLQHLGLFRDDQ